MNAGALPDARADARANAAAPPETATQRPVGGKLAVVGIGEDGWAGLGEAARASLLAAPVILGSDRQLALLPPEVDAVREPWPRPMTARLDALAAALQAGEDPTQWAVLASGDPMLHGVGSSLVARGVDASLLDVRPAPSAFALACARLGWPQHMTRLVSRVADAQAPVAALVSGGHRVVVYVAGASGAADLAAHLRAVGLGAARFTVMERLGGPDERIDATTASAWSGDADVLHLVAVEPQASAEPTDRSLGEGRLASRVPGLPDELYGGDGQLTRAEVRAVALAALAPSQGEVLWDIGAGSGTIAIEWCRAAPGARAEAIEQRADRAATIAANAEALGVADQVRVTVGDAPAALDGLPAPDAIFIGGGLTAGVLGQCWDALAPGGRLVANVVTLEGERELADAAAAHGGRLVRLELSHAEPIGRFTGWKPQRPITQWSATKAPDETNLP